MTIPTAKLGRRGARRLADVPVHVIRSLEAGAESANHIEQMAISMSGLMKTVLPNAPLGDFRIDSKKFLTRMRAAAAIAWDHLGYELFAEAATWSSDTARGWAAFAVPLTGLQLKQQFALAKPYAEDSHFAVREWAWLGVRPTVTQNVTLAVSELGFWARSPKPNVRRFAAEVIRPRGVWSSHLAEMKAAPQIGLPVLDAVVADRDRYVQDSVGNWLNDASKSQPAWVQEQLLRWQALHGVESLRYVTRRAVRSIPASRSPAKAEPVN